MKPWRNLPKLRGSLRLRLLLGTLLWIVLSICVAGWGLGTLFHQHVQAQFHAELGNYLNQLTAQLALDEQDQPSLRQLPSDPRFDKPLSGLYWQMDLLPSPTHPARTALMRSRSLWDEVLNVPSIQDNTRSPSATWRAHRLPGPHGLVLGAVERVVNLDTYSVRLVVAADEHMITEPIAHFKGQLWLALGILGAGLSLAAFMQVVVGLAPLRSLQAALTRVRQGQARQLEGTFPTEVTPLVNEFNTVLSHNAEVVERARTQTGNLAHALKTPLSVLANAVETLKTQDAELAQLLNAQVHSARQQIDHHLARAKTSALMRKQHQKTPVVPVVEGLLRVMSRVHAQRALHLVLRPPASHQDHITDLVFQGEEQDLQEMLGNLLDNACKWATTRVEVEVRTHHHRLLIHVDDDGQGIAPEQRAAIVRRGIRADEQVPGTGLGLDIVNSLARLYAGELHLDSSPLGGLQATLSLPLET